MFGESGAGESIANMVTDQTGIISVCPGTLYEGNVVEDLKFINEFLEVGRDVFGIPFFSTGTNLPSSSAKSGRMPVISPTVACA